MHPAAKKCHDNEKHKPARIAFFFGLLRRFFGFRLRFLAAASGHVVLADGAAHIYFPGFAFLGATANGGRGCLCASVLHECHEVGFVHLIKEMYGVLALVVPVNEDIKVIAVFGRYGDKLLVAAEIVYKSRIPVRGEGFFLFGFFIDNAAVVGRILSLRGLCKGGVAGACAL